MRMAPQIFTVERKPELEERLGEVGDPWPEFIHHDEVVNRHWPRLYDEFRHFQLVLYEEDGDTLLGKGCTIPVKWDGCTETLSDGVLDALEAGGDGNVLCALVAVVDPAHQGRGLSGTIIQGMAQIAAAHGLDCLIAPVRPTWKERYPLAPIERYMRWTRADGLPFDPWIRVHHRLGAELLRVARRALDIRGSVAEWEEWTGMAFPESGDYVVPGALVPVQIDRERDEGRYVEPNVWMRHAV
jgi:GNAT superfamily N-acetyltransferase